MEKWPEIESQLRELFTSMMRHQNIGHLDGEDILQDVWFVANEHYDSEKGDLLTFCVKVGRNLILDRVRHKRIVEKHQARLYTDSNVDVVSIKHVGDFIQAEKKGLEAKALEPLIHEDEWETEHKNKWLLVQAMMQGQSTEAQILWVMYNHIVEYDEVPSVAEIGRYLGKTRWAISLALDRIVQKVKKAELDPVIREQVYLNNVDELKRLMN